MTKPTKTKGKRDRSVSESSDSSERISVNDAASNASDLDVEFQFLDLTDSDFHGVSLLLGRLCPDAFDFSSLAEAIITQQNIGVKVVTDVEDGGVCAFASILSLKQHLEGVAGLGDLIKYIKKNTPAEAQSFFDPTNGNIGLFLGERIINLPPALGPQMHGVVVEDARWSLTPEAACPLEEVGFYKYTHVLVYSTFLLDPSDMGVVAGVAGKKKKKAKKEAAEIARSSRIYLHAEDEVLTDAAVCEWSWPAGEHDDGEKVYKKFRLCYVLHWDLYASQVERLVQAFSEAV